MAQTIQSTWDTISLGQRQTLIRTMPDRMQAVFQQEVVALDGRYYIIIIISNV